MDDPLDPPADRPLFVSNYVQPAHSTTNGASTISSDDTMPPSLHLPNPTTYNNTASPTQQLHRATSATGLNGRSGTSPNLTRKSSRTSLGAHTDDAEKGLTPKRSISNLISGLREAQAKMEPIEEPVALTASEVASGHFARELAAHSESSHQTETVVILHDACYGHRYSRPKTTKTTLSMIVERPERLHASILGASTAYVRLGGHHSGAKNEPHQSSIASPPPFRIQRTSRAMDITSSFVTNVHGTAWMSELRDLANGAGEKLAAGAKELSRSSTPTEPEKRKLHEGDLYLCSESLNAFQGALGGVADAVDTVFSPGITKRAFVAIRPPGHHCSADYPSGFCWLNNVHVGIEYAAQTYGLTHAVILDFDLHHGDGSQAITWQRNSSNNAKRVNAKPNSKLKLGPDIGYYSLHDINSYPCEMGDDEKVQAASLCIEDAHGQNVWNVHLHPWKTEKEFWDLYENQYAILLHKAKRFLQIHTSRLKSEGKVVPRAAVFLSAGFDASEWEGAGMQRHKVNVPTEFYARFTRDVVGLAQQDGLSCDGRVVSVLEGGYSDRALCSGVLSHLSGLCARPVESSSAENATLDGLDQMMRGLGINGAKLQDRLHYNKAWWSPSNLTALEMKVNPPPPPQAKKSRVGPQPTYATPTESFAYKVVDADKFARSISGTMREVQPPPSLPHQPRPEVDWVVATQELSKLLIPVHRQTKSCTAEELAGPKVKKEHVNTLAALTAVEPRQLRDRRSKASTYSESAHSDELASVRSVSRSNRRQTIAEFPSTSTSTAPSHQRRASRRLSASSALSSTTGDMDSIKPSVPARAVSMMQPPTVTAQGLPVKKTRPLVKKEAVPTTTSSPKRMGKPAQRLSGPASNPTSQANGDVDALTAGMKKVTLKVGTKEEHDRKQKEKLDAERRARALKAAETRKANAAAKKAAKDSTGAPAKVGVEQTMQQAKENTAPFSVDRLTEQVEQITMPQVSVPDAAQTSVVTAGPISPQYPASFSMDAVTTGATTPTAFQEPPTPFLSEGQQPTTFSRPSTNTEAVQTPAAIDFAQQTSMNGKPPSALAVFSSKLPSSPARSPSGAKLPVWSSTGVIPFSAPNGSLQEPSRQGSAPTASYTNLESAANAAPLHTQQQEPEASIWDVPVTLPK